MKRYLSLLLALVMVVGMFPATTVLAAEENTTPAAVEENFDDITLEYPSVDTIPGVGDYTAAQIKPAPGRTGSALWVGDETQTVVPSLSYTFESASNVTVEFDINAYDTNSLGGLKIYNGTMTNANTALWLNFNPSGLRYYDGAYSDYQDKATTTTTANTWINVRIELTTGAEGKADVYFDNSLVLEVPAPTKIGTSASAVNGICFQAANATKSFYLDNLKITPASYVATYTPSVACDFESMTVDAAPGAPALEPIQATVVARANGTGKNAVKLEDADTTLVGNLRMALPEKTDKMVAEFDLTYWKVAAQFWISNGVKGNNNMAYWLKIAGKNIQYYSGSAWVTMKTLDAVPSGWMKIRIEADLESADFYLNGELMGTAARCSSASYGKDVTDGFDSLIFVSGGANAANEGYYIDNVKLTGNTRNAVITPSTSCDFESMEVNAAPGAPITNASLATVVAVANGSSTKAVHLNDTAATSAACIGVNVEDSESLKLAFKYKGVKGAMQMYITDGNRATANTAFFLQFSGQNVQYYDGTAWQTLKKLDYYLTKWHDISIEATTTGAKISVDGVDVGEAPRVGGSYGTNVAKVLDSVYFVIGAAKSATESNCYIDDVILSGASYDQIVTPDAIDEDFDAYCPVASVEKVEQIVAATAATIVANPSGEGNVLQLHDAAGAAFGSFDYKFDLVDNYVLEFDAFIPDSGNDVCMQIHAGQGGNRLAYILAFNRAYGLRVLTGRHDTTSAWVNLEETATKLTPSSWNKIRVEVNPEGKNEAKVYLNDALVATTSEAYYKASEVVGANIYTGAATQNVYIDNIAVTPVVIEKTEATVTWIVDGVSTEETYQVGATPVYPGEEPTKTYDDEYHYTFGWDKEIAAVTADGATYTAVFTAVPHSGAWEQVTAPTMYEEGLERQTCQCGHVSERAIPVITIEGLEITEEGFRLTGDVSIDELIVEAEQILDLNGYTLTVGNLVAFGSVIDSSESNSGKLIASELVLSDMAYMPIYDSANGCMKFYAYELDALGVRKNADGSVTYGFAINFANADAYQLLASGNADVSVAMELGWEAEATEVFILSDELIQQYATLQLQYPEVPAAMMLTVTGLDALQTGAVVSVAANVQSNGVTKYFGRLSYAIPSVETTIADGTYVIATHTDKAVQCLDSSYGYLAAADMAEVNNKHIWTLTNTGNGTFYLQDHAGYYIYMKGTYNNFNRSETLPESGAEWQLWTAPNNGYYISNTFNDKYLSLSSYGTFGAYTNGKDDGDNAIFDLIVDEYEEVVEPQVMSIVDVLALTASPANEVIVEGRVSDIYNTTYGNFYIADEEGNLLCIYGSYDVDGNRFDVMENKPQVGDWVKIQGPVGFYKEVPQIVNGVVQEITPISAEPVEMTISDVLAMNVVPECQVILSGEIASVTNTGIGGVIITDEAGEQLAVNGLYDADGNQYNAMDVKPDEADIIKIQGTVGITNAGEIKVINAVILEHTAVEVEAPEEPVAGPLAVFEFPGAGGTGHVDGQALTATTYTDGNYTLTLTDLSKIYGPAQDIGAVGCIKFGTSSVVGTLTFEVPEEVDHVVIKVAGYKAKTSKLTINGGSAITLTAQSGTEAGSGSTEEITIDTSSTKTVTISTVSSACRMLLYSVTYHAAEE